MKIEYPRQREMVLIDLADGAVAGERHPHSGGRAVKVYIMQGIPGAGKSRWVTTLVKSLDGSGLRLDVVSADPYHVNKETGKYEFKQENQRHAHNSCLVNYTQVVSRESLLKHDFPNIPGAVLVVDNTNLSVWELAPYYRLAEALGHEVEIVRVECPPEVAAARNVHGLPAWKVGAMWQTLQQQKLLLPPWWRVRVVPYEDGPPVIHAPYEVKP